MSRWRCDGWPTWPSPRVGIGCRSKFRNPAPAPSYSGDGSRLAAAAPDFRFTPIADGVAQLADWYRERLDSLDRAALQTDR